MSRTRTIDRRTFLQGITTVSAGFCIGVNSPRSAQAANMQQLTDGFANPPASARPWVYWFWINGNLTKEGITADLEAMQRVGIGGVLIMDVDGSPQGKIAFGTEAWRDMFLLPARRRIV
jgi:hypothetical protein